MTTPTEIVLTNTEQIAQSIETSSTNYEKIREALTTVACLTFFPGIYLIGNWFFN